MAKKAEVTPSADEVVTLAPPVQNVGTPVFGPDVRVGNKYAVAFNAHEVLISLGSQRMLFRPDGESAGNVTEYHATYSLSPVAARQLKQILEAMLHSYESTFGVIPVDPPAEAKLGNLAADLAGKMKVAKGAAVKKARGKMH